MRHFLITVIGTLVGLILFFVCLFFLLGAIGAAVAMGDNDDKSGTTVLTLDLRDPLQDHSGNKGLFGPSPNSVVNIARTLSKAKSDDDVKGLFIRANEYGMVPASAEEIRLALLDFKSSGKFIVTHSQGFEGTSVLPYLAVSASDEIWQQDTTGFAVAGIRSETGFYGGIFEKLDAKPEMEQFYEYKNAANIYKESGYTDAHREATTSFLTSIYDTSVADISADRNLSPETVNAVLQSAPHSAESALESGMVDKLGHLEAAKSYAKTKAGGEDTLFKTVQAYGAPGYSTGPAIAFIGGQGPVVTGSSDDGSNPFSSSMSMGGDSVADAFDAAIKDKKVKSIVFRVSTPGGSPAASDQIHDAVARAKAAGKPVVVSMGQYAASGGYYVSANADKIVALRSTITGSIGVLGGKIALEDTFAKVGYNIEDINIGGEYVGAYSADAPFTDTQRAAYRGQLEDIYVDFTTRVAQGRDIPLSRVRDIAKGRVWTGEQAHELGLVDELGGVMKAIDVAKTLAEIDPEDDVYLKFFPRPKSTQQQIEEIFGASAKVSADISVLRELSELAEIKAIVEARKLTDNSKTGERALTATLPEIK